MSNTTEKQMNSEEPPNSSHAVDNMEIEIIDKAEDDHEVEKGNLIYGITERPPWLIAVIMALQHFSANFNGCLVIPFLLSRLLCFDKDPALLTQLIATAFFVSGISTLLQIIFGSRLPIIQGPSAAFIVPALSMLQVKGDCPAAITANSTEEEKHMVVEEAHSRMRELQGAVLVSALIQIVIGVTGLVGILLRFIGPITIAVTLIMIGFGVFPLASNFVGAHWCISLPTILLVIIFSMILSKWKVPLPGGKRFRIFAFFPMLLAIAIMWTVCAILTACGVFPDDSSVYGYAARTDLKMDNLRNSPWVSFPYPCQFGWPTFNLAGIVGTFSAILVSILDSVGDYHGCAQVSNAPPPPDHAVNRGIAVEGIGGFIAAIWGLGVGVASYSSDIALLSLTKVASRSVLIGSGLIYCLVAFCTKISAFLSGIPKPILGVAGIPIGMITAIGITNFSHVKIESNRNLLIVGVSLFLAVGIPDYLKQHPLSIDTGSATVDQLLGVLLYNGMLIGAVVSATLDLIIPGTPEEKGGHWRDQVDMDDVNENMKFQETYDVYDLPFWMKLIKRSKIFSKIPISPTFRKPVKSGEFVPIHSK